MLMRTTIFTAVCTFLAAMTLISCEKVVEEPQLESPVLSIVETGPTHFVIGWEPVDGATEYICAITDGPERPVVDCSVTYTGMVPGTYNVRVKAVGKGYEDSPWGRIEVTLEAVEQPTLAMELSYVEDGAFDISFTPSDNVSEIRYAVVSSVAMKLSESLAAFNDGSLESIETFVPGAENVVHIQRDSIGPYAVYAKAFNVDEGTESETVSGQIMAASAGFTVDAYDLVAMDVTSTVYDADQTSSGALVVSKQVLGELGMSIEELLETYAMFGMVPYVADGESMTVALNGYVNYDYIIGVVGFDASGMPASYGSFSLSTGDPDPSLSLPSPMTIEVSEVTESSARIKYTMGENTRIYYQMVTTLADYNDLIDYGSSLPDYEKPEDYVRDYAAVYGTPMFADDDYVWGGLAAGTDYVVLGFPANGNGAQGYGDMARADFTTAGSSSSSSVSVGAVVKEGVKVLRPVTADEVRALLR